MSDPKIISSYDPGLHAADIDKTISRLDHEGSWKDLSTVIVVPAGGTVPTRVVASWLNLMTPPNNKLVRLFAVGVEVGVAYEMCIDSILRHPQLSTWKYILTLEHDNIPPPDGLLQLQRRMEANPEYAAIGGAYYTKGYSGVLQAWGDPNEHPINFRPRKPAAGGGLLPVVGTGMGFTLFKTDLFRDSRLRRPWFKTLTGIEGQGVGTQDLFFWSNAFEHGFRAAIDLDCRVGHYSLEDDIVW